MEMGFFSIIPRELLKPYIVPLATNDGVSWLPLDLIPLKMYCRRLLSLRYRNLNRWLWHWLPSRNPSEVNDFTSIIVADSILQKDLTSSKGSSSSGLSVWFSYESQSSRFRKGAFSTSVQITPSSDSTN
jgi:hypothetical protein